MPLIVAVLYNTADDVLAALKSKPYSSTVPRVLSCDRLAGGEKTGTPSDACDEFDSVRTVGNYKRFFENLGHRVVMIPGDIHVIERLRELADAGTPVDICWNVCEGFRGLDREAQIPAILEMLGVPYAYPRPLSNALSLNKALTKKLFVYHGIPTPAFQEFTRDDEPLDASLKVKWPLFVKPNSEGTGMGITTKSIVHNEEELREELKVMLKSYGQSALVEEFIPGRDVTCGVVGNFDSENGLCVLEVNEVDYDKTKVPEEMLKAVGSKDNLFYNSEIKSLRGDDFHTICPAKLPDDVTLEIKRLTVEVYRIVMGRDAGRVDFRIDTRGGKLIPVVIEINTIPGMMDESDLTVFARGAGYSHKEMIQNIFAYACDRYGLDHGLTKRFPNNWPPKKNM